MKEIDDEDEEEKEKENKIEEKIEEDPLPPKPQKKTKTDLKIIIVGDSGTGKTSLINRYILNKFAETYSPTISSQFNYKILKKDDVFYRLNFWDIAGQDRNPTVTGVFCKDVNGIILCCEVNKVSTRENTIKWKKSIEGNINIDGIPIIIVENKCDLLGKDEQSYNKNIDDLKKLYEDNNLNKAFRVSALNGYGIENAMNFLIDEIIGNNEKKRNSINLNSRTSIVLNKEVSIRKRKKKCCDS